MWPPWSRFCASMNRRLASTLCWDWCSRGRVSARVFSKLVAITTEAKVHSATLQVDAGEVTRARFNASLTSGPGQEVSAIVAAALARYRTYRKSIRIIRYVQHGQQITTLRQLEDRMLARIASRATQKKAERQRMVLLVLIVAGLAVPGSLALGWKVARSVHLSLASLHAVANRVRRKVTSARGWSVPARTRWVNWATHGTR